MIKISIIIPVLNESGCIEENLRWLQLLRQNGHEVIVVDGGSTDNTMKIASHYADKVIAHDQGRALQMNAGATAASGDLFLFVHADTRLPALVDHLLRATAIDNEKFWGFFRVRLSGKSVLFRIIEFFMNQRSRLGKTGTGDQALFVTRNLFRQVNGYDEIPLMEDIAICKKLKKLSQPIYMNMPVLTSSRKWEAQGVISTVLLMWRLRLAYFLGVNPSLLAKKYYG
ncbi:MAG: TIGR04283 family arsenosugar biosynthesis glycosyltransferase [Gammaproteobacteria bacterium]|nr:TIGR04283 family arsenosugar biosynthesis glycosyltransferase [Gammaproteobacteria bacterium]